MLLSPPIVFVFVSNFFQAQKCRLVDATPSWVHVSASLSFSCSQYLLPFSEISWGNTFFSSSGLFVFWWYLKLLLKPTLKMLMHPNSKKSVTDLFPPTLSSRPLVEPCRTPLHTLMVGCNGLKWVESLLPAADNTNRRMFVERLKEWFRFLTKIRNLRFARTLGDCRGQSCEHKIHNVIDRNLELLLEAVFRGRVANVWSVWFVIQYSL